MAESPTAVKNIDQIRDKYGKARDTIRDKIVDAKKPEAGLDITTAIDRSRFVLEAVRKVAFGGK
jgi:hypothetical protein